MPTTPNHSRSRRRLTAVVLSTALLVTACGAEPSDDDDAADAPDVATSPDTTEPGDADAPTPPDEDAVAQDEAPATDEAAPAEEPAAGAAAGCATLPAGRTQFVLDAGGGEHDVLVYVPTSHDGASELPVVLNFHGFGSNGEQQAAFTGYEDLAEEEGFIVVHPTGIPASGDEQARPGWEVDGVDDPAKDDLAFFDELLDLLIADWCVDDSRVYATGMSGGGMFTSQLVCDRSDRIAAAVSVAAMTHADTCAPERAVPYVAIHGTADPTVPFDGDLTGTSFEGEPFAEVMFAGQPIPDEFAAVAAAMGCDAEPERTQRSPEVVATTYTGCDDGVPLELLEVTEGGHAWPSSPLTEPGSPTATRLAEIQGYSTFEIDATADGWAFMSQHRLDG